MVRFACERCGKRYAIQGVPVAGRKYRVTCKACGQVISFTGGEAAFGAAAESSAAAAPEHPQATTVSELLGQAPGSAATDATPSRGAALAAAPADPPALEPARATGPSYIDLFDDHDVERSPATADLPVDGPPSWRDLAPRPTPRPTPPPASRPPVARPAHGAERPREAEERTEVPHEGRVLRRFAVTFVVLWVAILGAAFGVWLWRRSDRPARPAPTASTQANASSGASTPGSAPQAEPPPPQAEPTAPPAALPPAAAPPSPAAPEAAASAPEGDPAGGDGSAGTLLPPPAPPPPHAQKRPDRRTSPRPAVRKAAPERRATASARDQRATAAVPTAPPAASPAAAPPATDPNSSLPEGLAEKEIRKVVDGARKSFQACLRDHSRGSSDGLGERQITLRFNVSPSGQVGYATIDDVEISSAPVGQCLKKAARGLVFPAFRGDPVRVDAPLSIPDR